MYVMYTLYCVHVCRDSYHNGVVLCGYESHEEDVSTTAVVALDYGFSQGRVRVEGHVLVAGSNQVLDDVRCGSVAPPVAEPFACEVK